VRYGGAKCRVLKGAIWEESALPSVGSMGYANRKFLKFYMQICSFWCFFHVPKVQDKILGAKDTPVPALFTHSLGSTPLERNIGQC